MPEGRPADDTWAPAVRSDVETAVIDGEMVIFDPTSSLVHQLNAIGSVVWQLLDGSSTVAELVADLAEVFEVPTEQVWSDVRQLLNMMGEQDLLADTDQRSSPTPWKQHHADEPNYLVDPPTP